MKLKKYAVDYYQNQKHIGLYVTEHENRAISEACKDMQNDSRINSFIIYRMLGGGRREKVLQVKR